MQINAASAVFIAVSKTVSTEEEQPAVRGLIFLGCHNLVYGVLGELNDRRFFDYHKIDVLTLFGSLLKSKYISKCFGTF